MKITKSFLKRIIMEELETEASKKKKKDEPLPENPDVYPDFATAAAAVKDGKEERAIFRDGKHGGLQFYGSVRKLPDGTFTVMSMSPVDYEYSHYGTPDPLDLSTYKKL